MSQEEVLKKKHKLFGNIDFVGELFRKGIISDNILKSVFHCLLGIQEGDEIIDTVDDVNDDTIEAAIQLINKLGADLQQKAAKQEKMRETLELTYGRFKNLQDMTETDPNNRASLRVKLLIKNMFENKNSGWQKSKAGTKELLKKADIEQQVMTAEHQKNMESRNRDYDDRGSGRYGDDRRGGDRRDDRGDRRGGRDDKGPMKKPDGKTGDRRDDRRDDRGGRGGGRGGDKPRFNDRDAAPSKGGQT